MSYRPDLNPAAGDWVAPQKANTALNRYGTVEEVAALVEFVAIRFHHRFLVGTKDLIPSEIPECSRSRCCECCRINPLNTARDDGMNDSRIRVSDNIWPLIFLTCAAIVAGGGDVEGKAAVERYCSIHLPT
jgi:hypothetical protein